MSAFFWGVSVGMCVFLVVAVIIFWENTRKQR